MARGDSLTRLFRLWMVLLDQRELVSVDEAAATLGCTRRTIYRDLGVLQRSGMPLYQAKIGRQVRWRLDEGFHRNLSIQFSVQEAMALVAGAQFLAPLAGTFFADSAAGALDKVRHALAPVVRKRLEQVVRHLSSSSAPARNLKPRRAQLDEVLRAVESLAVIELQYRKLNSTNDEKYTVEPHHLHMQGSSVYLVGWARERAAPRIFLLDRIDHVRVLDEHFVRRTEIGPGLYAQGAFGLWDGRDQKVRLRFLRDAATIVAEQHFHPTQKTTRERNGAVTLEFCLPVSPALTAWVRGFGKRVQVLAPKNLIREV